MNDDNSLPLVTVRALAYNHAPYIRKCLDGFIMQKTDFKFEVIVHDDCSTDGTIEILKEYAAKYPDIIKPIFEIENQWNKHDGTIGRIMNKYTKGKYIAWCECDDYWIDPYKLQKQVDILENNPDVQLVYTGFQTVDEKGNAIQIPYYIRNAKKSRSGMQFSKLICSNYIQTLTVCGMHSMKLDEESINSPGADYDWSIFLYASLKGDLFYLKDITGCYRINPNGMMISKAKQTTNAMKTIFEYYATLYNDKYASNDDWSECMITKYTIALRALDIFKKDKKLMNEFFKKNKIYIFYALLAFPHFFCQLIGKLFNKFISWK